MSSASSEATLPASRLPGSAPPAASGKAWFLGPRLDLLVMANLAWPLVALAALTAWSYPIRGETAWIGFLQAHFLVTPHRWLTLVLCFGDRDYYAKWKRPFLGLAAGVAAVCWLFHLQFGTEGFLILVMVDWLWNAWHFSSQHAGVYRIYGRRSRPDREEASGRLEKGLIRVFAFYVFFRLLGVVANEAFNLPYFAWLPQLARHPGLQWVDLIVLALPWVLLVRDLRDYRPAMRGRLIYLLSFGGLYSLILLGIHASGPATAERLETLIPALVLALGCFHSVEYVAIVSWTATRKQSPQGPIRHLIPHWLPFLGAFMVVLGGVAVFFYLSDFSRQNRLIWIWLWTNMLVSLLHYAYDGIIWRSPRKAA